MDTRRIRSHLGAESTMNNKAEENTSNISVWSINADIKDRRFKSKTSKVFSNDLQNYHERVKRRKNVEYGMRTGAKTLASSSVVISFSFDREEMNERKRKRASHKCCLGIPIDLITRRIREKLPGLSKTTIIRRNRRWHQSIPAILRYESEGKVRQKAS